MNRKNFTITKEDIIANESNWLEGLRYKFEYFALTVVFKDKVNNNEIRWTDEYNKRIIGKIAKLIYPSKRTNDFSKSLSPHSYYEKDIRSKFKNFTDQSPHHIHALLQIEKRRSFKIWDYHKNEISERLKKDLLSVDTVQSIEMKIISAGMIEGWLKYIQKGKIF